MTAFPNSVWDGGRRVDKYAAPDAADWQNITQEVQTIQKVIIENSSIYSGGTFVRGQPLVLEAGVLKLASQNTPEVIGVSLGAAGYVTQGQLTLEDWSMVTDFIALIPGEYYYLGNEEGKLTSTPLNQTGNVLVIVGRAQTLNNMDINIQPPIYL